MNLRYNWWSMIKFSPFLSSSSLLLCATSQVQVKWSVTWIKCLSFLRVFLIQLISNGNNKTVQIRIAGSEERERKVSEKDTCVTFPGNKFLSLEFCSLLTLFLSFFLTLSFSFFLTLFLGIQNTVGSLFQLLSHLSSFTLVLVTWSRDEKDNTSSSWFDYADTWSITLITHVMFVDWKIMMMNIFWSGVSIPNLDDVCWSLLQSM